MNINATAEVNTQVTGNTDGVAELRSQSEAIAKKMSSLVLNPSETLPYADLQSMAHELQVYQIELAMQCDELLRLRAELALSYSRSADVHDAAPYGYITVDPSGLISGVNGVGAAMLGATRASLNKTPFTNYIFSDDQDAYYLMRQQMGNTLDSCSCTLRLFGAGGSVSWFNLRCLAELREPNHRRYSLVLRYADIDLLTNDEANTASAAVYPAHSDPFESIIDFNYSILNSISSVAAILAHDGEILAVNAAWKQNGEINGASATVMAGVGLNYLQSFPGTPDCSPDMLTMRDGISRVLDGTQLSFQYDYDQTVNALTKRYRLNVTSMRSTAIRALLLHDDITDHYNSLLMEKEEHARLALALASFKNELEREKQLSKSSALIKGTLLETISHEIRTPLNSVLGLAGLLAESPTAVQQNAYVKKIQVAAHALRHMVDDVLDFSKIEAGELTLVNAAFSLEELLRGVVASMVGMLESKPIEVLIDIASDIPDRFTGDQFRIQQVLLNLCSNAAKFTSSGTITIDLRMDDSAAAQPTYRFCVVDTGCGISPEFLGRLFDCYTQENVVVRGPLGGSGLGLSICRRLVQLMGGTMHVQSQRGEGSEFSFAIPLQSDSVPLRSQLPANMRDMRVLVMGNHAGLRSNLQRTCVGFGWHVEAWDSTAASAALRQPVLQAPGLYDLVLLDWRAEGSDAMEFLQCLSACAWADTAKFVFVSSIGDMDTALLALRKQHPPGLFIKPISPFSLLEGVTRVLQGDTPSVPLAHAAPQQQLSGMRFLVADDSLLNLEILEHILSKAGAEVVLVSDGAQAVAQLRASEQAFDAVLMDLQMPVLDGYAATQAIRSELGLTSLPIIAVTAFARPENRQKSEQAGLSGHLVKPLNVQSLLDMLVQITNKPTASSVPQPTAPLPAPHTALALPGLDIPSAMESFAGDLPLYLRLLERFLAAHSDDAAGASKLVECGNIKGAFDLLHSLQGTAHMLRATELIQLTTAAELALMDAHSEQLPSLLQGIAQAMAVIAESVDQLRVVCPQQGGN